MSAQNPTGAGRPAGSKINPNETTSQKLSRLAGARVSKLRNAITAVANLGPLVHDYAKETGNTPDAVNAQIMSTIQEDFKAMVSALQSGKRAESAFKLTL